MCRKKKIKCDGKMPKCSHCSNYKTDCVFTQVEKKRNPPKGYVDLIETRFYIENWKCLMGDAAPNISKVWRIA